MYSTTGVNGYRVFLSNASKMTSKIHLKPVLRVNTNYQTNQKNSLLNCFENLGERMPAQFLMQFAPQRAFANLLK